MYLRRHGKNVDGEEYGYWSLVESVRTARGPRQRIVATIGKLPDFDKEERLGWEDIGRHLSGKSRQDSLFEKTEETPAWATLQSVNRRYQPGQCREAVQFRRYLSCLTALAPAWLFRILQGADT